jgi:threonine/homoserine/homoserine lactone efflux protein
VVEVAHLPLFLLASFGARLGKSRRLSRIERYGAGGLYIGLGLSAAFAHRR